MKSINAEKKEPHKPNPNEPLVNNLHLKELDHVLLIFDLDCMSKRMCAQLQRGLHDFRPEIIF